jgi:hypothetical protein
MKQIKLTQNKVALVDDEDFDLLSKWKWFAHKVKRSPGRFYAVRNIRNIKEERKIMMHRLVMDAPKDKCVDHIDGDGLNNQKNNLRICTTSQNFMNTEKRRNNTSGFKGVFKRPNRNKWYSVLTVNYKPRYLGSFSSPEIAHEAYEKACVKYQGEFANLLANKKLK